MKEFKKWWDKDSMEGDWDYEHYAAIGWERALEWVLSKVDSLNLDGTFSTAEEAYISVVHNIEKELEEK